ncbi:MAG: bifunctional UDP-N-acetylmuramoyl-tripeptide:D-alanyl-D-alanine ligase/alanine racemase [Vicingaceae bacterium]
MPGASYSAKEIRDITSAVMDGKERTEIVAHFATDSRYRSLGPETLFIALTTDRNDGHRFAHDAYSKGVRSFLVKNDWKSDLPADARLFHCLNPLEAFQQLAADYRQKLSFPIVGITGSNGKTVVKEWLFQLMTSQFKVGRSPKSYNSQIGLPHSLLLLPEELDLALIEAGISQRGEMIKLQKILKPSVGLITNVHQAHLENFSSTEELVREKLMLFKDCRTLLYRKDYDLIHRLAGQLKVPRCISWSLNQKLNPDILVQSRQQDQMTLVAFNWENKDLEFKLPFTDDASIENGVHCLILALILGTDSSVLAESSPLLQVVPMRLQQIQGVNNCTLINDAYTSDLVSLEIALHFLSMQRQHHKRTLILSDIVQSGIPANERYDKVIQLCRANKVDRIIAIGQEIGDYLSDKQIAAEVYPTTSDFISNLNRLDFFDETILLKGSRNFEFERISRILEYKKHETRLEVNLSAMIENLGYYRSVISKETKIMVMVKAFSYGTGSHEVANVLQHQGIDYLAVAYIDEGVNLRVNGITAPIMVINPAIGGIATMLEYDLEPEIYSLPSLHLVDAYTRNSGRSLKIHLKIDTGMHRLGLETEDLNHVCDMLSENPLLELASVFSHLSSSDNPDHDDFTAEQVALLDRFTDGIRAKTSRNFMCHLLNSDGIIRFPQHHKDMVRLGIGLYGISSLSNTSQVLKPVVSLKSVISQIKVVKKGESIGYSRGFVAEKDMVTATVPIGYADGLARELGNGNWLLRLNGGLAPIVGNVCMDMCMIDISNIKGVTERDSVVVMNGGEDIYAMAEKRNTIPYEILTSFSERVKRVFYYGE